MRKIEQILYKANEYSNRLEHLNILESEIVEISSINFDKISTSKTNNVNRATEEIALNKIEIVEERISIQKKLDHINSSIKNLSNDERNIINLRYFMRFAWMDIAESVAFSIRQCYRKRDLALDKLENELERYQDELC